MTFRVDVQQPLQVTSKRGSYPIVIHESAEHLIHSVHSILRKKPIVVVTHPHLAELYLPDIKAALTKVHPKSVDLFTVPSGDVHKTLAEAEKIWSFCTEKQLHRDAVFLALGGGMVGDLTGFAASCYMRGVGFVQFPTTLLAQVDAAIGGKTAVNIPQGKNLIGSFYAPSAVLIQTSTLNSLPDREFTAGLAEIIKYGMVLDADFFGWLENELKSLSQAPEKRLQAIVHSCALKAKVVGQDEFESSHRMLLNFGHTLGHAIESAMQYQGILHGEAVAIGMVFAAYLSCELKYVSYNVLERLVSLLQSVCLPTKLPKQLSTSLILDKLQMDKKFTEKMNWVLLKDLGKGFVSDELNIKQIENAIHHWSSY